MCSSDLRAFWFYLLNNGVVRGGVANSDSHTLTENVIGTPRTLIWSDNTVDDFDLASFDQAMRDGKMIGTNGPILVTTVSGPGEEWTPSTAAIQPSADDRLTITVDSAPWVPVEEIRVIVNGEVVQHLTDGIANATDPFAKKGTNRFYTTIPLTDILPAEGDAWIVVEAGTALADQDDLDCDGIPDTGDNEIGRAHV